MPTIYLDSTAENLTPTLALDAFGILPGDWNGYARPVATAEAMARLLDSWRTNDPNGTWGYVTEHGDTLVYPDPEQDEPDTFPRVGTDNHGSATYDLTGWAWITKSEPQITYRKINRYGSTAYAVAIDGEHVGTVYRDAYGDRWLARTPDGWVHDCHHATRAHAARRLTRRPGTI